MKGENIMKTIEQFYAEVKDNKELQQAFQAADAVTILPKAR